MTRRVCAVHPDGSKKYIHHSQAVSLIEKDQAAWFDANHKAVNILPAVLRCNPRLRLRDASCTLGADLAENYRAAHRAIRNSRGLSCEQDVACVIVATMQRRRESPSYVRAA